MELELVDITGYEGLYKINRSGQVWGVKRQHFMKPYFNKEGYATFHLTKEGKAKLLRLHRLLAIQFLPNPDNLLEVDHIDRIKSHNNLDNLRWVSHRGNCCNRTYQPISGEQHITIVDRASPYAVRVRIGNQVHRKFFKTMEEAIAHRDLILADLRNVAILLG
jgi:hypothetical protein